LKDRRGRMVVDTKISMQLFYALQDIDVLFHAFSNYLCNQCLSPLALRVQITLIARCTQYKNMCASELLLVSSGFLSPLIKLTSMT